MKLNKYALALILGLGTLASCNDNLELLNPNQQTSNTFGFNADDLEESVIAAYNHIRMEGSYARVGYTIDVCRGDEAWNSSQVWYLPFDDLNAEVTSDITWWPWREWYYTINVCNFAISQPQLALFDRTLTFCDPLKIMNDRLSEYHKQSEPRSFLYEKVI